MTSSTCFLIRIELKFEKENSLQKMKKKTSIGDDLNKAFLLDEDYKELQKYKKRKVSSKTKKNEVLQDPKASVEFYDQVLVARGFTCYLFDPRRLEFYPLHDMVRDRSYFEMVRIDRKILALSTFSLIAAGTVEWYNIDTNKWFTTTNLPRKLRSIAAAPKMNEGVMVMGGIDLDTMEKTEEVFEGTFQSDGTLEWKLMQSKLLTPRFRYDNFLNQYLINHNLPVIDMVPLQLQMVVFGLQEESYQLAMNLML